MAVRPDHFLDSIVEGLEEGLGHFDDRSGHNFLLLAFEQLLLIVS